MREEFFWSAMGHCYKAYICRFLFVENSLLVFEITFKSNDLLFVQKELTTRIRKNLIKLINFVKFNSASISILHCRFLI